MKARVKATGEIVDVMYSHTANDKGYDLIWYITPRGVCFSKKELEFIDTGESLGYWERLKHQYAGQAMQGLMTLLPNIGGIEGRTPNDEIVDIAVATATALVEKLKSENN